MLCFKSTDDYTINIFKKYLKLMSTSLIIMKCNLVFVRDLFLDAQMKLDCPVHWLVVVNNVQYVCVCVFSFTARNINSLLCYMRFCVSLYSCLINSSMTDKVFHSADKQICQQQQEWSVLRTGAWTVLSCLSVQQANPCSRYISIAVINHYCFLVSKNSEKFTPADQSMTASSG